MNRVRLHAAGQSIRDFGCAEIVAGAVYNPDELIVPVPAGLIDQVTAVLVVLVTVAVNC